MVSAVKARHLGPMCGFVIFGAFVSIYPVTIAFDRVGIFAALWVRATFITTALVGGLISVIGCILGFSLVLRAEKMQGSHGVDEWPHAAGGALACCAFGTTLMAIGYFIILNVASSRDGRRLHAVLCLIGLIYFFISTLVAATMSYWSFNDEGEDVDVFDMNAIKVQTSAAWSASNENDDAGGF